MSKSFSRVGVGLALSAVALSAHAVLFLDLPVLVEGRDFIHFRGWLTDVGVLPVLDGIFRPTGYNSRFVSMLTLHATAAVCGYKAACFNGVQIAMIAAAGVLIYVHVLQITGRLGFAVVSMALWYGSLATLDALGWQATNHDKVALLAGLGALTSTYAFLNIQGRGAVIASNIVVTTLIALAFNAKESSFFLVGAIPALAVLFSDRFPGGLRSAAARLAVPMAYAIGFVGCYFSTLRPEWAGHTLDGAPVRNTLAYAVGLLGLSDAGFQIHVPLASMRFALAVAFYALLAACVTFIVIRAWIETAAADERNILAKLTVFLRNAGELRVLTYFFLLFAGSVAIVTKAVYAAPYYLLTPSVGFLAFVFCAFGYAADVFAARSKAAARVLPVIAVAVLSFGTASQLATGGRMRTILDAGDNLNKAYEIIRQRVEPTENVRFNFVLDDVQEWFLWLFFDNLDEDEGHIVNFIFERPGEWRVGFPDAGSSEREGEYYIHLDGDLALTAITYGGRPIR